MNEWEIKTRRTGEQQQFIIIVVGGFDERFSFTYAQSETTCTTQAVVVGRSRRAAGITNSFVTIFFSRENNYTSKNSKRPVETHFVVINYFNTADLTYLPNYNYVIDWDKLRRDYAVYIPPPGGGFRLCGRARRRHRRREPRGSTGRSGSSA